MTPQAHRRYLPPADPPRESPARLLLAFVGLLLVVVAAVMVMAR
jgi:hypothetical protein